MGRRASPSITIGNFRSRWSCARCSWRQRTDSRQLRWPSGAWSDSAARRWRWRERKLCRNRKSGHLPGARWKIHEPQWEHHDAHRCRWIGSTAKRSDTASSTRQWTVAADAGSEHATLSATEFSRAIETLVSGAGLSWGSAWEIT